MFGLEDDLREEIKYLKEENAKLRSEIEQLSNDYDALDEAAGILEGALRRENAKLSAELMASQSEIAQLRKVVEMAKTRIAYDENLETDQYSRDVLTDRFAQALTELEQGE